MRNLLDILPYIAILVNKKARLFEGRALSFNIVIGA